MPSSAVMATARGIMREDGGSIGTGETVLDAAKKTSVRCRRATRRVGTAHWAA
ncbi:hypothetical protein [Streptomyces roseoviridis]|uniref:Uncharacterized protein n=1 Tax=Streptomyces roseoviridis TaxID=67361 RepID=A0ABV5QT68_9ACTN